MPAEAVQCMKYSGCREHEGYSRGHEGAYRMAILRVRRTIACLQRLYNVYSIVAVEGSRRGHEVACSMAILSVKKKPPACQQKLYTV
jgi:hypothetical protein